MCCGWRRSWTAKRIGKGVPEELRRTRTGQHQGGLPAAWRKNDVRDRVILGDRPRSPFIAQTEIQGQFGGNPPIILNPRHELPLAVLRVEQFWRQLKILRDTNQHVRHRITRHAAIENIQTVHEDFGKGFMMPDHMHPRPDQMLSTNQTHASLSLIPLAEPLPGTKVGKPPNVLPKPGVIKVGASDAASVARYSVDFQNVAGDIWRRVGEHSCFHKLLEQVIAELEVENGGGADGVGQMHGLRSDSLLFCLMKKLGIGGWWVVVNPVVDVVT